MIYLLTITRPGQLPRTYTATGSRDALMDAAYDDGALGVCIRRLK